MSDLMQGPYPTTAETSEVERRLRLAIAEANVDLAGSGVSLCLTCRDKLGAFVVQYDHPERVCCDGRVAMLELMGDVLDCHFCEAAKIAADQAIDGEAHFSLSADRAEDLRDRIASLAEALTNPAGLWADGASNTTNHIS